MNVFVHPSSLETQEAPKRPRSHAFLVATFHTSAVALLEASACVVAANANLGTHGPARTNHPNSSSARLLFNEPLPNSVPDLLSFVCNRSDCVVARVKVIAAAMATPESSEVLKNAGDHMVDMEDLFGNPKKEWRNPLVLCGAVATAGVLVAGLASFRQGNFRTSQMLMRTRVVFQAATVALMTGTVYYQGKS